MCGMVHIVSGISFKVGGSDQIERTENIPWDYWWNKKETQFGRWIEKDTCKYHRTHGSRCPQAAVILIVLVFDKSREQTKKQGQDIHSDVKVLSFFPKKNRIRKCIFYKFPEHIEGEHIKNEVHEIGMDQSTGKEAIPLIPLGDGRRIEDQVIHDFLVIEPSD